MLTEEDDTLGIPKEELGTSLASLLEPGFHLVVSRILDVELVTSFLKGTNRHINLAVYLNRSSIGNGFWFHSQGCEVAFWFSGVRIVW